MCILRTQGSTTYSCLIFNMVSGNKMFVFKNVNRGNSRERNECFEHFRWVLKIPNCNKINKSMIRYVKSNNILHQRWKIKRSPSLRKEAIYHGERHFEYCSSI
jgi:hypothetical protein